MKVGRPPLEDEVIEQRLSAYYTHDKNQTRAALALGISRGAMQDTLKAAALRGMMLDHPPAMPGFEISRVTTAPNGGQTIKQVREHGDVFEMPATHHLGKMTVNRDADGRIIQDWIRAEPDAIAREAARQAAIAGFKAEFEQYRGKAELIEPPEDTYEDLMQVYPVVDPHIGMLSWGAQTGQSNDLKIGLDRMYNGASNLISRAPPAKLAAIVNTGDFFHADDQRNVTPANHHQLDVDGRADKVRMAGLGLLRRMTDMALQKHETVILKNLRGNHDPESAGWLNIALGMFYENEPRVQIDPLDGNNDIWLYLFGKNYIGATHGHNMKPERMAMVMADDRPDYWGASEHRWFLFGHVHHETVKEVGSVICESFRQPVPKDSFAHSRGHRAGNSMSSVTLHKDGGEAYRHKINFPRYVR